MRNFASLTAAALLGLANLASAQQLQLAQTPGNNGNPNGGIYFNLTVNQVLTINSIDYDCKNDAAGTFQSSFRMYVGPSTYVGQVGTNPGPWVEVGSTTPVTLAGGTGAAGSGATVRINGVLNPAGANPGTVTFLPGTYGIALQAVNHQWRYQNFTTLQTFTDANMTVSAGAASNFFLALPTFSPRVICGNINYTLGGTPMQFAQRESYGAGCYANYRSFYELFPTSVNVDLSNTSMLMTFDSGNNRYSSITAGVTPINTAAVTSPDLALANDGIATVTLANSQPILFPNIGGVGLATTTVEVCANGFVTLLGSNPGTPANPAVNTFLAGSPRIGNWINMDPTGLSIAGGLPGTVNYDYDTLTGQHLFTWQNCILSGIAASPNSFQIAFLANGDVEFRWGAMSQLGGGTWPTLIGFTPGNGGVAGTSLDPGSRDISASFPFSTAGFDQNPLTLVGDVNPILGSTVNLTTSGETGLNLGVCFVSLAQSPFSPIGIDLGVIGAPGCVANVDLGPSVGNLISNLGLPGVSMTIPFGIPAGLQFTGLSFYCQSAWLDATQNPGGLITSNALRLKIGAF
jgi:hypothetical protein